MKNLFMLLFTIVFVDGYSQHAITPGKKILDLSLGLTMNGGNNPQYGGTIKSSFSYEKPRWEISLNPNFSLNYASVNNEISLVRREAYLVSTASKIRDKWKIGAISEVEHSLLKKMSIRFNCGAGPSFRLVNTKEFEISFSEYILVEGLKMNNKLSSNYFALRTSSRIKIAYKHKLFSCSSINLIQPVIYNNQDVSTSNMFIFRSTNRIDFTVAKSVTLGTQLDGKIESYPTYINSSVLPYDWNSVIALTYKFQ